MKLKTLFARILYWSFVLFIIYIIFELIRKIFGGSLTVDSLIISLMTIILGVLFRMNNTINKNLNKVDTKITRHIAWHKGTDSQN